MVTLFEPLIVTVEFPPTTTFELPLIETVAPSPIIMFDEFITELLPTEFSHNTFELSVTFNPLAFSK